VAHCTDMARGWITSLIDYLQEQNVALCRGRVTRWGLPNMWDTVGLSWSNNCNTNIYTDIY